MPPPGDPNTFIGSTVYGTFNVLNTGNGRSFGGRHYPCNTCGSYVAADTYRWLFIPVKRAAHYRVLKRVDGLMVRKVKDEVLRRMGLG